MFRFDYATHEVKQRLCDRDTFWDDLLTEELQPILKQLKDTGESSSDFGINPVVCGSMHKIRGRTFELTYAVLLEQKLVKFYDDACQGGEHGGEGNMLCASSHSGSMG